MVQLNPTALRYRYGHKSNSAILLLTPYIGGNKTSLMRNLLALMLFVPSLCLAQLPEFVPTDGLMAWYPFNGNADDESGNGNDGDVNGATLTEDEYGNSNSAYYFDGNDRIDIPHQNDFDWSAMTFVIVYKDYDNPNAVPNGNSTLVSKQPSSGWGSGWGFSTGDANTEFGRCMTTTAGNECLGWGENEWGDWNMVAYTHSIDSVKVYFNGSLISEEVALGGFISNSLPITIGMRGNGWVQFIGSISLIGIWNHVLTETEISALHNAELPVLGCTDSSACNFNSEANSDDGTCDYGCLYCGEGTVWDPVNEECIVANPTDTDLDGCTGVGDVLEVLSTFGQCYTTWTCGDPMNYHSYDYETVLIGDQCWFAENLRTTVYANGDLIPAGLTGEEWNSTTAGATAFYANNASSLEDFGRLYNWYAVNDMRGLCPSDWHVPSDEEFMTLEMELGMSETDANSIGWFRGTDEGAQLKASASDSPSWNGTNTSGFHGLSGGQRFGGGNFGDDPFCLWWSGTDSSGSAWSRILSSTYLTVKRDLVPSNHGLSVRCLKDAE